MNMCWSNWYQHVVNDLNIFGSWNLPYCDTINPNIGIDGTIKSYFSKFKLISNPKHLRKWNFNSSMEISIVLKIYNHQGIFS